VNQRSAKRAIKLWTVHLSLSAAATGGEFSKSKSDRTVARPAA
jgi:hypothetical protein